MRLKIFILPFIAFFVSGSIYSATISITSNTNWSAITTGSGAGGQPDATDDIVVGTNNVTLVVDVATAVCRDFTLGDATKDAILNFSTAGNKLTVNGDFKINTGDKNKVFDVNVGAGYLELAGTFSVWNGASAPKSEFTVTTGTLNIAPALALDAAYKNIRVQAAGTLIFGGLVTHSNGTVENTTAAGEVYFNAGYNRTATNATFTTMASENIYFGGNFSNAGNAITLNATSNAIFTGNSTITPTQAISFGNVQINSGVTVTQAGNITVAGNWTNNGGTLTPGATWIIFSGTSKAIGGSGTTTFAGIQMASSGSGVESSYTLNTSISCSQLFFTFGTANRSLTHSASTVTLTVNGNLTIQQPTGNNITNTWNINGGVGIVTGNFIFTGTNNTVTRIGKLSVTSGSFRLDGTLTWMPNTAIATEIISVTTGTITFNSSITMGSASGTLQVTSGGTIDFNGGAAPSFAFGGATAPVFTTSTASSIKFKTGFTNSNAALTIADGSTTYITGSGTITPGPGLTFGNITIESGNTMTLAGDISIKNSFTNNGGTFSGNYTVTFNGIATQTITSTSGTFTFYSITSNTTGPLAFASGTDVVVTNTLTMTAGLYNLNGQTLTLGSAGNSSTLSRAASATTNWIYGGTFKRFWPDAIAISSNSGDYYGLFPMGVTTASSYRPVELNTTVNITTGGDFSVSHNENYLTTALSPVYNDGGTNIERISNAPFNLAINGVVGGTFDLDITMTDLSPGTLSDLRLAIFTGGTTASAVGTHAAATGSAMAPTVKRTGISTLTDFNNDFRVATSNAAATPIRDVYFSIATGNWNTLGTWAVTSGGASCGCTPSTSGYVIIENGFVVTVDAPVTVDFIDIRTGSILSSSFNVTANKHVFTSGSGIFTQAAGTFTVSGNLTLAGTGSSVSTTLVVGNNLDIGSGTTLNLNTASSVAGNLTVNGTLSLGITTMTLSGTGAQIDGTGSVTGPGSLFINSNKSIVATASLTVDPVIAISGANTVTNLGTVTLTNNITGTVAGSTWTNAAGSTLNTTGNILATGTLNAAAAVNIVNYNGAGAQTVKTPAANYHNLVISNAGTKSMTSAFSVINALTIQDAAILDAVTYQLDGAASLTMTGTSQLKIQRNANTTFPEITGAYSLTGGTIHLAQTANSPVIRSAVYYNLILDGSRDFDANSLTTVTNNLTITGSCKKFNNAVLTVGNLFTYSTTNSSTLSNNITVGSFSMTAGTLNDGGYTIEVTDSIGFMHDGGTFTSSGTTILSGTRQQFIGGSASTIFYNLTLNNTAATEPQITLGNAITVKNNLDMTTMASRWTVNQNSNTLTIGTAVATPGSLVHDASIEAGYFYGGNIVRWFATSTFPAFTHSKGLFPLGTSVDYRPFWITVTTALSSGGNITISHTGDYSMPPYIPTSHNDATWGGGTTIEGVSNDYWTLSSSGITTGGATYFDIAYGGVGFGVPDLNDINASLNASVAGTYAAATNSYTEAEVNRTGLTLAELNGGGSRQFRIGTRDTLNTPLPIQLISFEAVLNDKQQVDLYWTTSSEINNDFFTIEKTKDGVLFEEVGRVDGAGNSNFVLNYTSVDKNPFSGISYYRLKQTDFDGSHTYSQLVMVNNSSTGDFSFNIFPNPLQGNNFFIHFGNSRLNGDVLIKLYDSEGRELFSTLKVTGDGSENIIAVDIQNKLCAGVYFVVALTDNGFFRQKLIVK